MPKKISGGEPSRPIHTPQEVAKEAKGIGNWFRKLFGKICEGLGKWRTGKSDTCARMRQQTITRVKPAATASVQEAKGKAAERGRRLSDTAQKAAQTNEHAAEFADAAAKANRKFDQLANTGWFARLGKFLSRR